ncbi:tRNA-specific 2-thiouridylase MnmA [Hibiscus syriacus]|uniref:tRNA-specific 2-thiouridylase MnmA n=1 Tax=Hibiscus syriacus TaxID=106335 RepID=A0A6A3B7B9_HIBSY|nr:tRNA-specific 2-thiouridylase MnmA [Hibiscus syriacus]
MLRLKPRLMPILSLPSSHFLRPPLSKPSFFSIASLPQTLPTSSYSLPHKHVPLLNSAATFIYDKLDPRFLSCCTPHKRLKVAVLLSGGVDSSVALHLLHAAGHSCTAFYLKIWFQEDFENYWTECPWEDDLKYARAVEVPLEVVHLTDEYWNNVVSYIIEEYRCGRTPNHDVLCNTRIKFGIESS